MSQIVELEITALAFGGEGIARHEGQVVFIPFTAPGDRVRAKITQKHKKFLRAEPLEFLLRGPGREIPPCPYFGTCGGCQYQHLEYDTELYWKTRQLRDALERIARLPGLPIDPIVRSPEAYGYRNRITLHLADDKIGFRDLGGRAVVDVKECLLADPEVNGELWKIRQSPPPRDRWTIRSSGVEGHAFYQANRFLLEALRTTVSTQLPPAPVLIEGYAGVGFFTEQVAGRYQRVVMIENDARAASVAEAKNLPHTTVLTGRCEDWFQHAWNTARGEEGAVCLVDPPREGLEESMTRILLELPFRRIAYLSCNPATLARDLGRLSSRWQPVKLTPFDLFPRTAHIECLAVLDPAGA
ncbi:MAG: TRAM domain-containing protein [Candidatus Methylacidiphilales bacterium]|nr:TRAM domain-containing protein [Candidatus Methylacidiphilales bacterium]